MNKLDDVVQALRQGEVIAYPTEGVFGLGCDPDNPAAIQKLLSIKQRAVEKGLILIAGEFSQLSPYVETSQLTEAQIQKAKQTWPGPVTWIMPASERTTSWVSGEFDTVAVRVTDHPLVAQVCQAFGKPLTSTSANLSGQPPCRTTQEVRQQLGDAEIVVLAGETGGRTNPSEIRDIQTAQIIRKG